MKLRAVASNMTQVETEDGVSVLFSYATPVACCIPGEGWYVTTKRWSATTSRHVTKWLGSVRAEGRPQEFFDGLLVLRRAT